MKLQLRDRLIFAPVRLTYRGATVQINDMLVDTGSSSTLISIDSVAAMGIQPDPADTIRRIRGVGGVEYVFSRQVDVLRMGGHQACDIHVEFGDLDYGFRMDGILGLDVLMRMGAVLDLGNLRLEFAPQSTG
ncbi:MAG: retropepsin-like domain-containing protein [Xanthomonadales bacterium]|jgi:predicted aspartyl protease|nr:retropepsin-like domain-containing protein [Xanthomonadales bacterium]